MGTSMIGIPQGAEIDKREWCENGRESQEKVAIHQINGIQQVQRAEEYLCRKAAEDRESSMQWVFI